MAIEAHVQEQIPAGLDFALNQVRSGAVLVGFRFYISNGSCSISIRNLSRTAVVISSRAAAKSA